MKKIIIAIDGYSGCGKSSTAKQVARQLAYNYIDSGAMYRATTLYFLEHNIATQHVESINEALQHIDINFLYNPLTQKSQLWLNGQNVEDEIRTMRVSNYVSTVSAIPIVRQMMVKLQQKLGEKKGIVMDGRDIGTTVFPQAELKIFMTADIVVRAKRRQQELQEKNQQVSLNDIIENLTERDYQDTNRTESPLKKAPDAYLLDTTHLAFAEQVNLVTTLAHHRITTPLLETNAPLPRPA